MGLQDTRKGYSGRPSEKELSIEEKYERLKAQNHLLKAENELLKKIDRAERKLSSNLGLWRIESLSVYLYDPLFDFKLIS